MESIQPSNRFFNFFIALLFALSVSLVPQMNKLASVFQLPLLVLFLRYFLAFFGILCLQAVGILKCSWKGKKKRPILLLNAAAYALSYGMQIVGVMYAPSWLGAVMFATVPIWAEILAFLLLKEHAALTQTLLVCASVAALIFMLFMQHNGNAGGITVKGFLLLVLSAIFEACSNTLIRYLRTEYTPAEISFASCGLALLLVTFVLAGSFIQTPQALSQIPETLFRPDFLLPVLYLGLFGTLLAGILKAAMLARMSALKASAWLNVASALSILFGVLLLKETLQAYQVICCIIIAGGVLGIQASKAAPHKPAS